MVLRDANFLETVVDTGSGFGSNITDNISYSDTDHTDYDSANYQLNDGPVFGVRDKY
jgi:hypothetical protein